ncbi:hypothetical protein ACUTFZ_29580, partial [Klebsiella pneumoniae]|uniref:hypothetical protein n=1 Tax=Klebsiella pneumoniae TaxID=573 RepID=UPI00404453C8
VVTADVHDVNVKNWGWHSTGLCGFAITEAAYAGMAQAGTLEIRDYETNILLYRKSRLLGATQRRLFFLDHTLAQSNP